MNAIDLPRVTRRTATPEEIIKDRRIHSRPRFRHFVREIYNPRAKHGVSHKQYTSAKMRVIDGRPFATYKGDLVELTATIIAIDGRAPLVLDLRVKSAWLPSIC